MPAGAAPSGRRRDKAMRAARRHSSRVRILKIVLPLAAIGLVVVFVGQSWLTSVPIEGVSIEGTVIEDGRLVMTNPSIDGHTGDNVPYSVTARRAIQEIGDAQRVDLEGIDATLPLKDGRSARISAEKGHLDRDANMLDITSPMTVETDDGMTARFRSASVDISNGELTTGEPVDITMDGTQISADTMQLLDNGARIVFENRVRMEIDARQLQTADRSGDPDDEN